MSPYAPDRWRTHYIDGVPFELAYEALTLPEFLDRSVHNYPDRPALLFQGNQLRYRELDRSVNQLAHFLLESGIRKGDRVALVLPNIIPCVIAYYAILKIGAVAVMNNPLYTDRELKHQLNDSEARLVFTLDLLADRLEALRRETKVEKVIYASIGDYLPAPVKWIFPFVGPKKGLAARVTPTDTLIPWKQVLKNRPVTPPPNLPDVGLTDMAMLQYTGGTTGVSKGAVLTHENLSRQVQQIMAWFPGLEQGKETMLGALPFFHVFGLTVSMNWSIAMGWQNALVPKPQPDPLVQTLSKYRPTILPMVPTMFLGILDHPKIDAMDLSFATACFSGSAPIPQEVIRRFEEKTGAVICEGFGMTESCPVTHINPFHPDKRKVGSIGIPLPDTEARIVDVATGETEIPPGDTGEMVIRGPQVMQGYWNMASETANTIRNGWLHTGDIATMDTDGYFYIVDRKKDMIIAGGYNIYPRDVEEVLFACKGVQEACVIGVPHPTRGETVRAYVVKQNGAMITEGDIIAHCKEQLAIYKVPTEIVFRDALPKSTVGKVLKKDLRKEVRS